MKQIIYWSPYIPLLGSMVMGAAIAGTDMELCINTNDYKTNFKHLFWSNILSGSVWAVLAIIIF